jgi:hypothetical protein
VKLLPRLTRRSRARAAYAKAERAAYRVFTETSETTVATPTDLAYLLEESADLEWRLGMLASVAWSDTVVDVEGRLLCDSHYNAALMIRLIASTETAEGIADRSIERDWEPYIGAVLDSLACAREAGHRAELLTRLYIAAYPLVGDTAAEYIELLRNTYVQIALNQPTAPSTNGLPDWMHSHLGQAAPADTQGSAS